MCKKAILSFGLIFSFFSPTACDMAKSIQENEETLKLMQVQIEENKSDYQQLKTTLDEVLLNYNTLKENYQALHNKYQTQTVEFTSLREFFTAQSPLYKKVTADQLTMTKILETKSEKSGSQPQVELVDEAGKKVKSIQFYFIAAQENAKQYKIPFTYDTRTAKWIENAKIEATETLNNLETFSRDTQAQYSFLKDDFYSLQYDYNKDGKLDTILVNIPPVGHILFDGTKKTHEFVENLNEMKIYIAVIDSDGKSLLFNRLIEENIDFAFNQSTGISPKGIFPVKINNKDYIMIFFWKKPGEIGGKYFFRLYEPANFTLMYTTEILDKGIDNTNFDEGLFCYDEIIKPLLKDVDGDKQNELFLFSSLKDSHAKVTVFKLSVKARK